MERNNNVLTKVKRMPLHLRLGESKKIKSRWEGKQVFPLEDRLERRSAFQRTMLKEAGEKIRALAEMPLVEYFYPMLDAFDAFSLSRFVMGYTNHIAKETGHFSYEKHIAKMPFAKACSESEKYYDIESDEYTDFLLNLLTPIIRSDFRLPFLNVDYRDFYYYFIDRADSSLAKMIRKNIEKTGVEQTVGSYFGSRYEKYINMTEKSPEEAAEFVAAISRQIIFPFSELWSACYSDSDISNDASKAVDPDDERMEGTGDEKEKH